MGYSVDSASACVEAAEALWPGQGCYGQAWASLIQAVDYADQPQGCMKQLSAGGGCALLFNTNYASAQAARCPAQTTCEVVCVQPSSPTAVPTPAPPAPTPQTQYIDVGNGNCVGGMYSVDSASACVEAAEALWPGQGCYGQAWASLIQAVDYADQPQGCMKQLSAGGGCALLFNTNYASAQVARCPAQTTCEVVCIEA